MIEAEYRPDGEQFAEGSASDQTFTVGNSVDLEGNISALVQQERAKVEGVIGKEKADVYIRSWMGRKLHAMSHQQATDEANSFLLHLGYAYDVVAFSAYDDDTQDTVAMGLRGYAMVYDQTSITLNPFGVRLLDAMAAATNIPNYTPGQQKIELSHAIDLTEVSDLFEGEPGQ